MDSKLNAIMEYVPGGSQAALFETKLQQTTGWTSAFCKRAIWEYKRFVYLASVADQPVTPSTVVDEVWHLHLTFTRCYWDGLCGRVLEQKLHHEPAMAAEQAAMDEQYLHTLALYQQQFGEMPDPELWPTEPKRTQTHRTGNLATPILLTSTLLGTATTADADVGAVDSAGWGLWVFFMVLACLVLHSWVRASRKTRRVRKRNRRYGSNSYISSCSAGGNSDSGDGGAGCGSSCGGGGCGS